MITLLAYLALFGWIPVVLVMFAMLPRIVAVSFAIIGAWLILPPYALPIAGLPDYSKISAAALGVTLGTMIFCPDRLIRFRPRWFDLPMLLWCFFTGITSSVQNGLGVYDGLSDALALTAMWGLPYLVGRLYFGELDSLRNFAVAMTVGGLCWIIPCVWEMRMSPTLLSKIYGIGDRGGMAKAIRLGGYRPQVFFWTGLELALWMMAASLAGWWLWRCGALKKIGQIPIRPGAFADPDGDRDPMPLDRSDHPDGHGHHDPVVVRPFADAAATGRSVTRGASVRCSPHHRSMDRRGGRGDG